MSIPSVSGPAINSTVSIRNNAPMSVETANVSGHTYTHSTSNSSIAPALIPTTEAETKGVETQQKLPKTASYTYLVRGGRGRDFTIYGKPAEIANLLANPKKHICEAIEAFRPGIKMEHFDLVETSTPDATSFTVNFRPSAPKEKSARTLSS